MEHQEKRRRLNGRLEGAWTALLFQLHLGPDSLASHPSAEPLLAVSLPGMGPRKSDAVARTAVSLAFLRAFKEQVVVPLLGAGVTTKEVVEFLVKPLAAGQQCLASRLPAAAVGVPTVRALVMDIASLPACVYSRALSISLFPGVRQPRVGIVSLWRRVPCLWLRS